jgi:hypothetical protein
MIRPSVVSDSNYSEYKAAWNIPENYQLFREHYHFGYCPTFRQYWNDGKGKYFCDEDIEHAIYVHAGRRFLGWSTLREYLRDVWRPKDMDGQNWYCANVA